MAAINLGRVALGGLLAGLVINVGEFVLNAVVLGDEMAVLRENFALGDLGSGQVLASVVITFLYGIALIWIYAAIRPRFGPGPRTAITAGLVLWVLAYVLFASTLWAAGMFTARLAIVTSVWGLFEAPIAALAGAWLYVEHDRTA